MPIFDYVCPVGQVTESRQNRDVGSIPCSCGEKAEKLSVYRFNLGGGLQPKYHVSEYQEAASEANYYHGRMEETKGEIIRPRDLVKEAKQKARIMGARVKV